MICESSRRINAFNAKVFNGNILHMLDGHRYGIDGNYYWHCSCGNNFLTCEKVFNGGMQAGYTTYDVSGLRWKVLLNAANPTDALIDLLIWVRKEAPDGR